MINAVGFGIEFGWLWTTALSHLGTEFAKKFHCRRAMVDLN